MKIETHARKGSDVQLKECECVQVKNYKDVGKHIMQWQENGWCLHTYSCAHVSIDADAYDYLLFERDAGS